MGDVIGVAVLFGVPFGLFIWTQWRREERERQRRSEQHGSEGPPGRDSYWGGMGRPGR